MHKVRGRRKNKRRGFTLIEVMVSLGVMTIGAMAVIGLQQQTMRANVYSQQASVALNIAELWVERLKEDAASWTQVGYFNQPGRPTAATVLGGTQYLNTVNTNPGVFQAIPAGLNAFPSDRFDAAGREIDVTVNDTHFYCVSFRPSWVYFGRAIRVDVRVFWPRPGQEGDFLANFGSNCGAAQAQLDPGGSEEAKNHFLYLPTVIRVTQP